MSYLATPKHYTPADFAKLVDGLTWRKGWKPLFPTLHNTATPSLKQYMAYGDGPKERWGSNLNAFYRSKGWHSGVHIVACPDYLWVLCDLELDGVSVSCWNHVTIGIEMIGDYETEAFDTGPGAKVRDNAVAALAILSKKLGWHPDPLVPGKSGLHFHRMCAADHHPCPGKNVNRADVVKRVVAAMQLPVSVDARPPSAKVA